VSTRFAKVGDAHVAYRTWGEGPLDLLYFEEVPVDMLDDEPRLASALNRLSSIGRVIAFNPRGLGLSDRLDHAGAPTEDERLDDAIAVLDAVGCDRAALLGFTFMAHSAIDLAARHPDRTRALVLFNARPRWRRAEDYPFGYEEQEVADAIRKVVDPDPPPDDPPLIGGPAPSVADDPAFMSWWERAGHRRASPSMAAAVFEDRTRVDVRALLPHVDTPTLVIQGDAVEMLDVGHGRYLAEHIPGAKLVELHGRDMIWWICDFHAAADEIEAFLTEGGGTRRGRRSLATVLFVDVVASTERAAQLGDRRWRELLDTYHKVAVRLIDRYGGRRISTSGDGLLATFEIPADAVVSAGALADAVRALDIDIRAGVHTGEIEVLEDDVAGIGVHIAARVMSAATPGEVLVSRTVVDLVTGSGLAFEERGEHELKGVPGRWTLHALIP
jgi:class 3 adenylate cyclase/pimeloyl-ACP methyl ester carboxylesterase